MPIIPLSEVVLETSLREWKMVKDCLKRKEYKNSLSLNISATNMILLIVIFGLTRFILTFIITMQSN